MMVSLTLRSHLQDEGHRLSVQQFVDCSNRAVSAMMVSLMLRSHLQDEGHRLPVQRFFEGEERSGLL